MGTYVCEANNGIPPTAKQNFEVQVHCEFSFISFTLQSLFYLKQYTTLKEDQDLGKVLVQSFLTFAFIKHLFGPISQLFVSFLFSICINVSSLSTYKRKE